MNRFQIYQYLHGTSAKIKTIYFFALIISLSVCCFTPQAQAGPAPIQTFFVPLPERQVQRSLEAVDTGTDDIGNMMRSLISIAATGDNTIIYYDHWEDGYELDLANPVQATTEIWGDNDPANGIPPGFGTDVIDAGDVITLINNVWLPRNPAQIRYDGRDKFGGTRAAAVTRASWAVSPGVVLAGAVEVYPLRDYGLRFEVPVGEDLGSNEMFQYTSLFVLAAEDGTDIQIDIDGNGTTDITQTLNQGESYQVDGGIDTGASVTASKPVQAHIFTGDIGARFESRFYTLYPVENWSDSYYSPVGTAVDGDESYVFVYNPNGSAITVNYETRIGTGSFAVAAGSTFRYLMPSMSGAHFFTGDGSTFFAIATVGADPGANLVHDWGFSLLPESYLTPMAVVGWGPGSDDLSENGSPVWVTAVAATTVYVDYDGDPATGPLTDANGDQYDVALNLAMLESAQVYDNTDNDQTGMRLYTLDGTLITAAWGQDPANSGGGSPYLDLGTTVLPFPIASVEKTSALVVDDNSNGLVDWGDTIEYTITVNNDGVIVLGGVVAFDGLPTGTTYVPGSTTLNGAPAADETVPPAATEYPLDEGGLAMPVIPPTDFSTITFRVTVDFGTTAITNSVSINTNQEVLTTDDTIDVNTPAVTACNLTFTDGGGVSQAVYPENGAIYVTVDDNDWNTDAGTAQSFTVVVVNADSGDVETITLVETGNDSGIFRNSAALPSSVTGGMSHEDGTLHAKAGNTLQVAYTDPVFGDTCSDTAGITITTEIKPLYLSEPGQSMDRVDPVATGDITTATSVELSAGGGIPVTTTLSPVADTWIRNTQPNINNGLQTELRTRPGPSVIEHGFMRFDISGIPAGVDIQSATLNVYSKSDKNNNTTVYRLLTVWDEGTDADNSGATWNYPVAGTSTPWAGGGGFSSADYDSATSYGTIDHNGVGWKQANISGLVDAWVNGGQSNNGLVFLAGGADDVEGQYHSREESDTSRRPYLEVVYSNSGSSSSTVFTQSPAMCQDFFIPTGGAVTVTNYINVVAGSGSMTRSIAASSDDAEEEGPDGTSPGTMYLISSDLELTADLEPSTSGTQKIGLRFNNITVPPDATITNAYITFRAVAPDSPNTNSGATSLTIEGQAADNPGTFPGTAYDITNRPRTTASAGWSPSAWTTGSSYNTPDLSTIAQELVDRSGWAGGNSMVFIVTGSGSRSAESWDGTGTNPPQLTIEYTTNSMPANPNISATIKHDGTTIETLTNPTVTNLGADIYRLDWTDVISSDTTVLADEQVELEITTAEAGVSFEILYDSSTYPSKILLPTTTVIVIHVDTLTAYDAPYPGGSSITDAENGATLYLRAMVSDPFGTDDITDLNLSISNPCGGGPINVTLDDGDVVATSSCSKTYEYVWNTSMCQGNYDIVAVANEGTEGITDSAAIRVTLSFTDTGTAGSSTFTDGAGNPVSNYNADATICAQVIDMDQNTNPAVAETLSADVASPQGDSETMTLTETGPDSGIFRACIASSSTVPGADDDGSLYALPGDVLAAGYTDPDDPGDISNDTALVNTPAADMTISKLLVDPVDGTARVNDLIRFDIVVGSPGPTDITTVNVTDTFDDACLSYDAASITPGSIGAGNITWDETELGILPAGSSVTISVWFTADAVCVPTVNTVSAGGQDQFGTAVSDGPATAQVSITRPELSVTKTLISPNPGPAYVGDPVTFRITLENTGTSVVTTLPLADTFSAACFTYQAATVAPDGVGAGSLAWDNLGPLAVSASTSLDVILTVSGECNPAQNTADVGFAVDENSDSVPPVQDSAGLQTIGAKIGDRVWNDRNGDGVQDAGEGGIANVIVFVDINDDGSRDAGEPYDTTDASGAYDITDLAAGTYTVRVDAATIPAGAALTGGSNPLAVTVADGEDFNTADFGFQGNASIGDFIWDDTNGDGNQDGGEAGLGSVTVFLDGDGDGVLDAGEAFAVTDGSGNYDFTSLVPGGYVVDVDDTTLPPNYVLTTGGASLSLTLAAGEDYNAADFGYRQQGGVNGHIFDDVDGNGVQDAGEADLAGIDVVIADSNGDQQTVTTDADGDYQAFLPPGATSLDVDDITLPPNAFITTGNDPQTVTVIAGAFTDSSDVGYQLGIPSRMKMRTGFYTGNGIDGTTITGLGFEPDLVIIKVADDTKEGVMRTSSMTDDNSKPMGGATALEADLIQSLDADGFTIGADDRVNKDTLTYHWIAFEAGDGEMVVDSYIGTGVDNTSVSGVGYQPDYVMVLPAINKEPVHRSSAQTGDTTMFFKNTASVTNHIQALQADGFQVGDDDRINKLNETYHYIAWKEVAGKMAVDSYDGNATDGTEISGLGFEPEYVIIKQDNAKEAVHRPDSLGGDNTLWFKNESQSADMIQQLQSDGFQIGLDDTVNAASETYFWAAFAGSHLTISSAVDQAFYVNDPATVIRTITITEDNLDPTITTANDIRIRIPAGFNMTWDTSVTTASIGGMAAAKVATAVTYEDGGKTLVLDVSSDFAASDQITVSLLRFNNFTAGSPADNLELEVDDAATLAAVDDKTIAVAAPTISSAADQTFSVGDPAREISTISITEDSISPTITAGDDIRVRIPAGFNMTWATSDFTAVIGGAAAGKVSTMVSYEDGGQTLVLDVIADFNASDQITIADLSFTDFTSISAADNLELEVKNDGVVQNIDDKTIAIADLSISSAENQEFIVGDSATPISAITVTDGTTAALVTAANDIRIRIPDDFYMLWDTSDTAAVIGGAAASKVSATVSYEDGGKTLLLDVTSDFAASDQITISGLSFTNFTEASFGDRLELEVFNDGATVTEDDKWKAIGGAPSVAGTMLVYGEGSVITPRSRSWQGAPSLSFSAEASANNTDDVIKWVVLKPSPTTNEMILGTYSSADKNLYIQTWDGTSWTSNWNITTSYEDVSRFFDIAYEKNSGDVMVVFGERSDNSLRYRKRVGGTWDSTDQIIGEISPDNDIFWVKAESRPGSDDIFVAAVSGSKSLYALRWDGTSNSWGDNISMLGAAGVKNQNTEGFDIAFESASGDAFLIWGDGAQNVKYREFTTSWQSENTAYASMDDDAYWLAAAYDPLSSSSNIAIGMMREDGVLEFGAWNGSGWATRPAAISAKSRDQRSIDVAFESDTGEAVFGFAQDVAGDDAQKFAWRTWTSAGGFGSVTVEDGLSDEIMFVQLKADPNSDDIMAVYADKAKDLYHRFWDGSTWTDLAAPLETAISDESQQEAFMFAWKASPPTAIDLIAFSATGQDNTVQVEWQTAREIDNLGFYLHRAENPAGPFNRLTEQLIPGSALAVQHRGYRYIDSGAVPGNLYYYTLEDVDSRGKHTRHGPICVDWDADGLPDDWEIARGLDPFIDDADLDPDGDGFSNLDEYRHHTDPLNPDTDGDGILDGADDGRLGQAGHHSGRGLGRGVELLESDESGLTLELRTAGFETTVIKQAGREFDRLRIAEYVHGYTAETGRPQMPIKGILVDVPPDMAAGLSILATDVQVHTGFQVYPVPANQAEQNESGAHVADRFVIDEAAYSQNAFYPRAAARLGESYVFRGRTKQQVVFQPLAANPFTGQMIQYRRIRLRINFAAAPHRTAAVVNPAPWQPPKAATSFEPSAATAVLAGVWSLPSTFVSPVLSALFSLGGLSAAVWGPPADSGQAVYKIMLSGEGIYRIDRPFMLQQGLAASAIDGIDLSRVRLYHLGRELAVYIHDQGSPDFFDPGDYLEFYGRPVQAPYAKYTADNVYWLISGGGSGTPRRMAAVDGTPQGAHPAATHPASVRYEENKLPWLAAPGADELERWFFMATVSGAGVQGGGSAVNYNLNLPAVAGDGRLTITLYGAYDTDHAVTVAVNGATQGTFNWRGITTTTVEISGLALQENNVIALQCLTDLDTIYVDAFEVLYPKNYYAAADALKFSHPTGYRFLIDNLAGSGPAVYDITADDDVLRIWGFDQSAGSPYHVEFEPPDDPPSGEARTWLVVTDDGVKTPAAMVEDSPSNLADTQNSADFILITLRELGWEPGGSERPWLDQLTARRRDQGLTVTAVAVEDIYDEFGYGRSGPYAVRDFLAYTFSDWTAPAPRYVLLVGDGTYDPKNHWRWYLADTTPYLPTFLTFTEYKGETVSDDWLACISGADAVPDLYIGRLPAKDAAEAAVMVDKILNYETTPNTKGWEKNTVLVADNRLPGDEHAYEAIFETINEDAAALLPTGFNAPYRGYLNDYAASAYLTDDLKRQINSPGALIVNYAGHGSTQIWAEEQIFNTGDVADLANAATLPFVVGMSCETGYFAYPESWYFPSLTEALLRSTAGAVAALMPSGMTTTGGQHILNSALFDAIFSEDTRQLGPAVATAKQTLLANGEPYYEEISMTFLLFGDPAMELKVPLPHRPAGLEAAGQTHAISLQWQAAVDCDGQAVEGYNLYRSSTADGPYDKLNAALLTDTAYLDAAALPDDVVRAAAAAISTDTPYYYVVKSVDAEGDESVSSRQVSAAAASLPPIIDQLNTTKGGSGGGGGGGGGLCFVASTIETTAASLFICKWPFISMVGWLALIGLLWLGKKRRG